MVSAENVQIVEMYLWTNCNVISWQKKQVKVGCFFKHFFPCSKLSFKLNSNVVDDLIFLDKLDSKNILLVRTFLQSLKKRKNETELGKSYYEKCFNFLLAFFPW